MESEMRKWSESFQKWNSELSVKNCFPCHLKILFRDLKRRKNKKFLVENHKQLSHPNS